MPKFGLRKQSECIFDSDRRFEFRRIRDIRVQDIESRLYIYVIYFLVFICRDLHNHYRCRLQDPHYRRERGEGKTTDMGHCRPGAIQNHHIHVCAHLYCPSCHNPLLHACIGNVPFQDLDIYRRR